MMLVEQIKEMSKFHHFLSKKQEKDSIKMEKTQQSTKKEWTNKVRSKTS